MRKTIEKWLSELDEPYRSQATENTRIECDGMLDLKVESKTKALEGAFVWKRSPQGQTYWSVLHEKLLNNETRTNPTIIQRLSQISRILWQIIKRHRPNGS